MGTPAFAAFCLERLLETRHHVAAVVTRPDKPRGRGLELQPSAVKRIALARGLEVLSPASAKDPTLAERFRSIRPDLAVVVAYGRILPTSLIEIPRLGCINAHASLLPQLRGAAPIERAILEGLSETGVTIMRIVEELDAGDMLLSRSVPIRDDTDAGALRDTLARTAADLLIEAIEMLAGGTASFVPQDSRCATFAPPLHRDEARIDWSRPAAEVSRRVRAFAPRPGAFTFATGRRMKVLVGHPADETTSAAPGTVLGPREDCVAVACGGGVYLLETVQPEGKRVMSAAAWARGNPDVPTLGEHV